MDSTLIETVNKLQDVFSALGTTTNPIDLPQIAVVGSQSSGKSSVLENIVGRDFLPRGSGIVTRRPLVLQLTYVPANTNQLAPGQKLPDGQNANEWDEFLHQPGTKYYDFDAIRNEIVAETERVTGTNVGISPAPITLRVFSDKVLTLTLVDLPGLTKVPVGDQPPDIERQIREMILKYISRPSCVILSVTAANTDLANSDGLKLAREVDPQGARTLGVLTKIDLMDKGTDVVDILAQKVIKLRLGFVPVINRSQHDIETRKSISDALDYEREFFERHEKYAANARYTGTRHLAERLNKLLMMHIRATLPDTKNKITTSLVKYREELQQLGGNLDGSANSPSNVLLDIITTLANEYRTVLDGNSDDLSTIELSGGARISFVFHELYANGVRAVDPFEHVKDVDIRTILYNSSGSSPALFVATQGFEVIVKQQIKRFEGPSLRCITLIFDELVRIVNQILQQPIYKRYPQLRDALYNETMLYLRSLVEPTNKLVSDMVSMESSYINTGHPDFIDGHTAMALVSEKHKSTVADKKAAANKANTAVDGQGKNVAFKDGFFGSFFGGKASKKKMAAMDAPPPILKASGTLSERESMETDVIKLLIQSYFNIVKRTTIDMVPKAVMLSLVESSKTGLQNHLIKSLYASSAIESLLKESDFVVDRRNECNKMVQTLEKASIILDSLK